MYDELVKRLRCQCFGNCPNCPMWYTEEVEPNLWRERCAAIDAADAIEELQKQIDAWVEPERKALIKSLPRWICVKERLPEVRTWVLCYCRANSFDVFRMTDEGHWQYGNRSVYMKGYVTHWMPLPEPPKEET